MKEVVKTLSRGKHGPFYAKGQAISNDGIDLDLPDNSGHSNQNVDITLMEMHTWYFEQCIGSSVVFDVWPVQISK